MTTLNLSSQQLEAKPGTHVYVPDLPSDYKSIYTGKLLKTIANPNPEMAMEIVNHINLPPFCTATNNPGSKSSMTITYQGRKELIEVFTFEKYINSFIGHMMVRDVEYLTQEFAREIATALGQGIQVEAFYDLVGFKYGQGVTVRVTITDEQAAQYRAEYPTKYQSYLEQQASK